MLNKINSITFYISSLAFILNASIYLMGFIEIINAINYALVIFGFVCLTLALMLTKKSPIKLKMAIVGLIVAGSLIWTASVFKWLDLKIYWKYALLLIFTGIIWAIWNKIFFRGNRWTKILFSLSAALLLITSILTCFSFFDNSDLLFYSLVSYTFSAMLILIMHSLKQKIK